MFTLQNTYLIHKLELNVNYGVAFDFLFIFIGYDDHNAKNNIKYKYNLIGETFLLLKNKKEYEQRLTTYNNNNDLTKLYNDNHNNKKEGKKGEFYVIILPHIVTSSL